MRIETELTRKTLLIFLLNFIGDISFLAGVSAHSEHNSGSNFYNLLEISQNASKTTIKKAFKKKAYEYLPERNVGNEDAHRKYEELERA